MVDFTTLRHWFREEIARHLAERGSPSGTGGGRVLGFREELTLPEALISAATRHGWDPDAFIDLPGVDELVFWTDWAQHTGIYSDAHASWLVKCCDCRHVHGRAWGLLQLRVDDYGLIIANGDDLCYDDGRIFALWTPATDDSVFRQALITAYELAWSVICLPPILLSCGQICEDYTGLWRMLFRRIVRDDPARGWKDIADYFSDRSSYGYECALERDAIDKADPAWAALAALTPDELAERIRKGDLDPTEQDLVLRALEKAVFVDAP